MLLTATDTEPLVDAVPAWMGEGLFWIGLAVLVLAVALLAGLWAVLARLREVEREARRLRALEGLEAQIGRLVAEREDLDLRRIEHVLIDVRDGLRRLEDALLGTVEALRRVDGLASDELVPAPPFADALGERIVNRMLALGYERVQIVTGADKLSGLATKDGEVLVEARRDGVLHKGRMVVRTGRLADLEIHPTYSIFP